MSRSRNAGRLKSWANTWNSESSEVPPGHISVGGGRSYGSQRLQWITNTRAIYIGSFFDPEEYRFMELDSDTGQSTPLNSLNTSLKSHLKRSSDRSQEIVTEYNPPPFAVSPNEKAIAFGVTSEPDAKLGGSVEDFTCDMNGEIQKRWRRKKLDWDAASERMLWLDSIHIADLEHNMGYPPRECAVYSLD